ncbi:MAG TPA: arsenic resistance N-acetyltransferase ArsN2 [Flavisolibacter sp.]|jgi:amino-acid N-acetyltransferase|nr:arsenic resistance N-acetyltransferase ArsN2 [Flavisolibacter sp.]
MNIVPASQNSFSAAIELLKKNDLPTEDLNPGTQLFVVEEGDKVVGTVAVEYNYNDALLRSLSVSEDKRNSGIGKDLVLFIEAYVQQQGVRNIFLLTTTAADFFTKRGYTIIDRSDVPQFIQNTKEYSIICASSSTLMKKVL